MPGQTHLIRHQIFELDIDADEAESKALLDRVRLLYDEKVLPELERILDDLVPPDLWIQIDQLPPVELGDLYAADWEDVFASRCIQELRTHLEEKIAAVRTSGASQDGVVVMPSGQAMMERLQRYLQTGWFPDRDFVGRDRSLQEVMAELIKSDGVALFGFLAEVEEPAVVARRLAWHFSDLFPKPLEGVLFELLRKVGMSNPETALRAEGITLQFLPGGLAVGVSRAAILHLVFLLLRFRKAVTSDNAAWIRLIQHFLSSPSLPDAPAGLSPATLPPPQRPRVAFLLALALENRNLFQRPLPEDTLGDRLPALQQLPAPWQGYLRSLSQDLSSGAAAATQPPSPVDVDELQRRYLMAVTGASTASRPRKPHAQEYYAVPFAGVVLLYPFLQRFFDKAGLLEKGRFRSHRDAHQAVTLLLYLCTFDLSAEEDQLWFLKLLCGLPMHTPVLPGLEPEPEQTEAIHTLLDAVTGHWKALGDSSPEALQEAFLQRKGKLSKVDSGWRLQVDSMVMDVLLARIPWGFSVVTFPWLELVVFVEWS